MDETLVERGLPIEQAKKAWIFLHGRGGTASDILSLVDFFGEASAYIAAPQAPNRTWYPHGFMDEEKLNEPWLTQSLGIINHLVEKIVKVIPKENIYFIGFSQGACLSLETTARSATKYGGIVAFAGGLIGSFVDQTKYHGDYQETPIFIGVNEEDPHIPLIRCQESQTLLEKMGASVNLKVYPGAYHRINQDEIHWARKILSSL